MQDNLLSDCPIEAILQYMSQNTSTYDMIECGRSKTCLSTNLGGNNSTGKLNMKKMSATNAKAVQIFDTHTFFILLIYFNLIPS